MNSGEFTEPRLLHSEGFIQLCVDKSGTDLSGSFLSSGTDGDVWIWTGNELNDADYDPLNLQERAHCAIAWHSDSIYVGHTSTDVQTNIQKAAVSRFEKKSFRMVATITNFSLDVTAIDISTSGKILAAGSVDHVLKIINLETNDVFRFESDGQIMCVSFDPKDEFLAITSTDGMLHVFTISVGGISKSITVRICSHIVDLEPSNPRLQLCWCPSGNSLFVPALGCVRRFRRNSFEELSRFSHRSTEYEMFSVCCASPCGIYIAASTMKGFISVWQVQNGELLTCSKYQINGQPKVICAMFWHRTIRDTLFFADTEEHICSLTKCVKSASADAVFNLNIEPSDKERLSSPNLKTVEASRLSEDFNAIEKSYGFSGEGSYHRRIDGNRQNPYAFPSVELLPGNKFPVVPKTFVTASTPEHLSHRYLKWNHFGTIISLTDGDDSVIQINWHDTSVHSEIIIDNSIKNFSIADMTDEIVALASKAEGSSLSKLQVQCIKVWDHDSRYWDISLPEGESIENLAIGKSFLVVATSQRYFRTFSHAGTQKIVFCYAGPLLTLCAFNNLFTAVIVRGGAYHEDDEPQFDVRPILIDVIHEKFCRLIANVYEMNTVIWNKRQSLVQSVPVSLSRSSKLDWIGYTNYGALCTMDSKCCCRLLLTNGIWIPIYNFSTKLKTKSDHIFPISIMDYPQHEIRYVYCRGLTYPLVESRLVPVVVKWQLPLCNQDSEKSQLEEKLLLTEIRRCALNDDVAPEECELSEIFAGYTKHVVQLYALACKAGREIRAAEFATYAETSEVIQLMCNFAVKTRHLLLADKVAEIGRLNAKQQHARCEDIRRKRSAVSNDDVKGNDSLIPKRPKKKRSSTEVATEKIERRREEKLNDVHMEDLDSSLDNTLSTTLGPPVNLRRPFNPFKRKSEDASDSNDGNFFESLASSSTYISENAGSSDQWKKVEGNIARARFPIKGSAKNCTVNEMHEKKTGFQLWLKCMDAELKKDYHDDDSNYLKYATKQFRRLKAEEKQQWNDRSRV